MKRVLQISGLICVLFCFSCSTTVDSEQELLQWLNKKDQGFVKKTKANGFVMTMKYLPPEYLAINEMGKDEENGRQSIEEYLKEFKNSRTFLLTIQHDDENVDAGTYGVRNLQEYNQRIQALSFGLKQAIQLKTDSGKKYEPVLTTMENLYEIGNKKSIYIVFSGEHQEIFTSEKLDIVFQDTYLDTGISHFVFQKKNIDQLPTLTFLNK